jgi:HlyD family secretion protein
MNTSLSRLQAGFLLATLFIIGCSAKEAPYYQGYVEVELVYLASSRQGVLNNLFAAKGQSVQQGETVFELDPNPEALQVVEMHHRIQQASAQLADLKKGERPLELATIQSRLTKAREALDLAKRDLKRRQELDKLGGSDTISEEELDRFQTEVNLRQADAVTIEAELNTARLGGRTDAIVARASEVDVLVASLNQLKWQLREKKVASPSAGTIQDIFYRVGEFVPSGRPVLSLLPPENLKIRFFVPQAHLPELQVGSAIRVELDGADAPIKATVSFISPEAEFTPPIIYSRESRTKLVFMMEAIPEIKAIGRLRAGQPVEVFRD